MQRNEREGGFIVSLLTSFLKLFKFTDDGIFDITKIDDNMDKLDTAIKNLSEGKEPTIIKKSGFNLDITDLVNSTSSIILASAKAVKTAYDKAIEAIGFTNTNKAAILNNTEQIESLRFSKIATFKLEADGHLLSFYVRRHGDFISIDISGNVAITGTAGNTYQGVFTDVDFLIKYSTRANLVEGIANLSAELHINSDGSIFIQCGNTINNQATGSCFQIAKTLK